MKPFSKLVVTAFSFFAFSALINIGSQKKLWPVPDADKNKKNPVANTVASLSTGKTLWSTHCKSCHGTKGLGDGTKASQLDIPPGDFTKNEFQAQTDGALFYKTFVGRGDMPGFKSKISDPEDIWSLVNYMRGFKKGGVTPTVTTVPVKDTVKTVKPVVKPVEKPVEKPVVVTPPAIIKDTIAKKESLSVEEQLKLLGKRVDSLERSFNLIKARVDSMRKN